MSITNPNPLTFTAPPNPSRTLRLSCPSQLRCRAAADASSDWLSMKAPQAEDISKAAEEESGSKTKSKKKGWLWWRRDDESYLADHSDALPMAFSGVQTDRRKKNMEGEEEEVYEWTAKCRRCCGTGFASYYSKKGRETIYKCVPCQGIGYVQKITSRKSVIIEDLGNGKPT